MRFGPTEVEDAVGALSAHSLRVGEVHIRKGARVSASDAAHLRAAGITSIIAVRLDEGDVGEDEAALRLAQAVCGEGIRVERPFTGRSNLYATGAGLLVVDRDVIDGINAADETLTIATLPTFRPVLEGEMVGTVKIIPYAVSAKALDGALAAASRAIPAMQIAPYRLRRIGAISTLTPGFKLSVVAKTIRVLGHRLAPAGAEVVEEGQAAHATAPLAIELARQLAAGLDLIVIFGASAIADRRDVIPAAIEEVGGTIEHFGMPVDPGNLLLVGRVGSVPVIGAPGCARSPKENGFDWVLQRLLAGLPVHRRDIVTMGVGGLLAETPARGQPRGGGQPSAGEASDGEGEEE